MMGTDYKIFFLEPPLKTRNKVLMALAILILSAAGIMVYTLSPMEGILPTGQITPELWAVKDTMVNFFLLKDGDKYIAIDAGMRPDTLRTEMEKLGIDPAKVQAVFFTHSDPDHIGGLSLFTQARFFLPEEEVPLATGGADRKMFGNSFRSKDFPVKYETIQAGESQKLGGLTITAHSTPGHTPGSTSYRVNDYLFTGDLLMLRSGKAEATWSPLNNDTEQSLVSLKKLATEKNVLRLLTAHSGMTEDFEGAMAPFLEAN